MCIKQICIFGAERRRERLAECTKADRSLQTCSKRIMEKMKNIVCGGKCSNDSSTVGNVQKNVKEKYLNFSTYKEQEIKKFSSLAPSLPFTVDEVHGLCIQLLRLFYVRTMQI